MLRSVARLCLITLTALPVVYASGASAHPASRYAHALQIAAKRDAFWRHHGSARIVSARFMLPPDVMNRKKTYWDSQQRGRSYENVPEPLAP